MLRWDEDNAQFLAAPCVAAWLLRHFTQGASLYGGRGCFVNGLGLRFAQAALVALSLHLCGDRAAACIVPAAFAAFTSTEPIWRCGKQLSVYVAASWSGFTCIYMCIDIYQKINFSQKNADEASFCVSSLYVQS